VNEDPAERNRRSVYIFVRRNTRYPMLESLDMPDTHESCGRRNMTTYRARRPLTLLNSKLTLEWAQAFAARVLSTAGECRRASRWKLPINWPTRGSPDATGTADCSRIFGAAAGHHCCAPGSHSGSSHAGARTEATGPRLQRSWICVTC
jgi:hypothetical protein